MRNAIQYSLYIHNLMRQTDKHHGNSATIRSDERIARCNNVGQSRNTQEIYNKKLSYRRDSARCGCRAYRLSSLIQPKCSVQPTFVKFANALLSYLLIY